MGDLPLARPGTPGRRWAGGLVGALLFLPLAPAIAQFWALRSDSRAAEAAALRELASQKPNPAAWGVLGTIRLEQGRVAEALPLLVKAAALEAKDPRDTRDSLALAKANLDGLALGLPPASLQGAEAALQQAQGEAQNLAPGKRAATWFSAGEYWQQMGRKAEAIAALRTAVALQKDDWVDEGGGLRFKSAGISAYYQKMLAGALEN
jgi:tetratricopeptide (TPR) repeat protein